MKELSIEEKAMAYDKAIERAKELLYVSDKESLQCKTIESVLPELKEEESEDEKIRKFLIDFIKVCRWSEKEDQGWPSKEDCIVWLEKQGEQKSIWHNEDEEPQRDSLILLVMQRGTPIVAKIIEPNHTFNHGERWAYIDDLLEKQGEHANFRSKIQVGDRVTRNEDGVLVNLSQLERVANKYNITGIGSKNAQGKLGEMIKNLKPVNEILEQKPYGQRVECLDCQFNYAGECKGSCPIKRD